ncbi:MAG: EAL domain-containing protein [Candidatus Phytoplasma sp.]|nr:EAL domain-containing protein [Phytoplasma sp.]
MKDMINLEPNLQTLEKIEIALSQAMPLSDYQTLMIKKIEVLYELQRHQEAIEEIMPYLKQKEFQQPLANDEKLYHETFKHALKLKRDDLCQEMIQKRKERLPIERRYLAIEDEITYLTTKNEPIEHLLLELLSTVINQSDKRKYLGQLMELYSSQNDYQSAVLIYEKNESSDVDKGLYGRYLEALLQIDEPTKAQALSLKYIDHPMVKKDAYYVLMTCYINQNDQHRLMILETEHEDFIEEQDEKFQLKVYEKLLSFYQSISNKPSITLYESKIKRIKRNLKKEDKPTNLDLVESVKSDETFTDQPISPLYKPKKDNQYVFQFEALHDMILFSHQINEQKILREYLRTFFSKLEDYIKPIEFIVYLKEEKELYQYKKERLYDKKIIDSWLYETPFEHTLNTHEEIMSTTTSLKFKKNIITQKPYEENISYLYVFPIENIGVFGIHLEENLIEPSKYYDLLKGISHILYTHLIDERVYLKLRNENLFLTKVINSPLVCYRLLSDKITHYNQAAQQLLSIEPHLPLELFLIDMEYHQVNVYKRVIKDLMSKPNQEKELIYLYQNRQIREKLYSIYDQNEIKIISFFEDLTKTQEEKNKLLEEATVDIETRVLNLNALNRHMNQYLEEKGSFFLIELLGDHKTIYGYEETVKFYLEFAQVTKKYFNEGMTYRYDDKQWLVFVSQNDIRTCTKLIKGYLKHLDEYLPQSLKYEQFKVIISALRYPVSTTDKNKMHIYRYLEIALDKAKRLKNEFIFFEYQMYEEEIFEQQVIDYLNVALEQKQFVLSFNQIIDIEKNIIWQYESEIALSNISIDHKYLYQIAKKRNRLFELEKYHVKLVCEFLRQLEAETKKLIKLTIPITKETFLDPTFNAYVLGVFKTYQIPYEFIRLKCIADEIKESHKVRINELIDHAISLDATSLDVALTHPFNALHMNHKKLDDKWKFYLQSINKVLTELKIAFVIRNVKTKTERDELKNLGIRYVEGNVYKKVTSEDLIQKIKEVASDGL